MTDSSSSPDSAEVTRLLLAWRDGDTDSLESLLPLVYDELRRLAGRYMQGEGAGHTLQATALVHEAYLKLVKADVSWADRSHFFAVAARSMRRILVDHAKGKKRLKRGGDAVKLSLDEAINVGTEASGTLMDLDEALTRLAEFDERKAKLIELHFFGGLTYDESAEVLGVSAATVHRDLRMAKAWLNRELTQEADPE